MGKWALAKALRSVTAVSPGLVQRILAEIGAKQLPLYKAALTRQPGSS